MPSRPGGDEGFVEHEGARLWYVVHGRGVPVFLLHGGLGHSGNLGHQVPALLEAGYRVILMDSRGHGRSTRDDRPYSYALMASDLQAVMDHLGIDRAALVGWSDGACIGLVLASQVPDRVSGVFFFACNMDPSGARDPIEFTPVVKRCFSRHVQDYQRLTTT
ncbi:MAG TPA: alpha/beta fold hydrolase, partial [Candidatus Xenobia bacterium]